jgi:hypothetical protein
MSQRLNNLFSNNGLICMSINSFPKAPFNNIAVISIETFGSLLTRLLIMSWLSELDSNCFEIDSNLICHNTVSGCFYTDKIC